MMTWFQRTVWRPTFVFGLTRGGLLRHFIRTARPGKRLGVALCSCCFRRIDHCWHRDSGQLCKRTCAVIDSVQMVQPDGVPIPQLLRQQYSENWKAQSTVIHG
jgi:hypothetical protein